MKDPADSLRSNALSKEALAITEYFYDQLDSEQNGFPEEETWNSKHKLRSAANDLMFDVAVAVGNREREAGMYEWNSARKHLFALQVTYTFSCRRNYMKIDPDMMVRINHLLNKIDGEIEKAKAVRDQRERIEMEQWTEKYKLWVAMQENGDQ